MMSIKLSERLMSLAEMAGVVQSAADIGCDHGRLSVYLAQHGAKVIAVDISRQSLKKAQELSAMRGVSDKVDCRLGNGLEVIMPGEAQGIIISGIGQRNTAEILLKGMLVAKSSKFLVLQPMDGAMLLRRELCRLGYRILDETLTREGKRLHPVIKAAPAQSKVDLSTVELALGPILLKSKHQYMQEYLHQQLKTFRSIADGLKKAEEVPENELMDIQKIMDAIGGI